MNNLDASLNLSHYERLYKKSDRKFLLRKIAMLDLEVQRLRHRTVDDYISEMINNAISYEHP